VLRFVRNLSPRLWTQRRKGTCHVFRLTTFSVTTDIARKRIPTRWLGDI